MNPGNPPVMPVTHFIGLDLGKLQDWTAIAILETQKVATGWDQANWGWKMELRRKLKFLERPPLGTTYVDIVKRVTEILLRDELSSTDCDLVVDSTGVGVSVTDMIKVALSNIRSRAPRVTLTPVMIHGGGTTTHTSRSWNVPKKDLVDNLAVML